MRVRKTKLGQLTPLAEGGFGKVYRVGGITCPVTRHALAYKEFTADHDAEQAGRRRPRSRSATGWARPTRPTSTATRRGPARSSTTGAGQSSGC